MATAKTSRKNDYDKNMWERRQAKLESFRTRTGLKGDMQNGSLAEPVGRNTNRTGVRQDWSQTGLESDRTGVRQDWSQTGLESGRTE